MRHITEDLLRWARETPDSLFLIDESGTAFSYEEVLRRARLVAGGLLERGVTRSDRVMLLVPNGIDYLAAYWVFRYYELDKHPATEAHREVLALEPGSL